MRVGRSCPTWRWSGAGGGVVSADKIQTYRDNADHCRRQASSTRDPETKASWLKLAEDWLGMAQSAERQAESTSDPAPDTKPSES